MLGIKKNNKLIYREILEYFDFAINNVLEKKNLKEYKTIEKSHGRIETRNYYVTTNLECIYDKEKWASVKTIGAVTNIRELNGKKTTKTKYYISDLELAPEEFAKITRNHWQIENNLHWVLDVHFNEDLSKSKKNNAIQNLSLLRKICFNLIKLDNSFGEVSIKRKMNYYNWDLYNLKRLIFGTFSEVNLPVS